jgi:hypothetical protein
MRSGYTPESWWVHRCLPYSSSPQISTIPSQHHPTGYIVSNADDLLSIFDADAGLLVIGDGCKLLGSNEQGTAMLAIAEYLRITRFE